MKYRDEILYRKEVIGKVHNGEKLSKQEREWLVTHKVYNEILGYPFLSVDILEIEKKCSINIKVEECNHNSRIAPVFGIPLGKGEIVACFDTFDRKGEKNTKPIKMLSLDVETKKEFNIECHSSSGLLTIFYQCDYYDDKMKMYKRESSYGANLSFAMIEEKICDNKYRFRCKSPLSDTFDALIFVVEWRQSD